VSLVKSYPLDFASLPIDMAAILNKHNPFDHFQKLVIYLLINYDVSFMFHRLVIQLFKIFSFKFQPFFQVFE
jgi:hypothetical protein